MGVFSFDGISPRFAMAFLGPAALWVLLARCTTCWLLALPGVIWLSAPVCIWTVSHMYQGAKYWDGRAQLMGAAPTLGIAQTAFMALGFTTSLCAFMLGVSFSIWSSVIGLNSASAP